MYSRQSHIIKNHNLTLECLSARNGAQVRWVCGYILFFPPNVKGHQRIRAVTSFDMDSDVAAVVSYAGDVQFIDYEYSGYNYLAYDIGNHFNEFAGKNWICEVKVNWFCKNSFLHILFFSICIFT